MERMMTNGPTKAKFTYWCGWEVDNDIPQSHMVDRWPDGMKGWESGFADGFTTWVARVDAHSAKEAERIVRNCYGKSGPKIRMRWEPEQNALGYRPSGGRFPE